jgi:hypothetical protein
MRHFIVGMVMTAVAALSGCSRTTEPSSSIRSLETGTQVSFDSTANTTYQIGTEMGKKLVTSDQMASESAFFVRMAKATAKVRTATGFYIGFFNGFHVVATNHHVCPSVAACLNSDVRFPMLDNRTFEVTKVFGTWDSIDLALLAIDVRDQTEADLLAEVANNFEFNEAPGHGSMLTTMGFGIANNPGRQLFANQDSDCKVFSRPDDIRLMADPDELNPGPYKAWSFSNGCDVSHGDSGSAMMDRETGKIVGIIWTGKIPKNPKVRDAGYTDRVFAEYSAEIWTELSLAVPAVKMKEVLEEVAANGSTSEETATTINAVLAN